MRLLLLGLLPFALLLVTAPAIADPLKITLYNDGISCSAHCDAHVVLYKKMNGTQHAHLPGSAEKCRAGELCEVCLDGNGGQCIEVMYRGNGPAKNRLDFTPAFFLERCARNDNPPLLAAHCQTMNQNARKLTDRVNCINSPAAPQCADMMNGAIRDQQADAVLLAECQSMGERAFNAARTPEQQRAHGCTYSQLSTGGPNSKGEKWKRLMPAACGEGTFVGRDGLDCCIGEPLIDASLYRECALFYPVRANE